MIDRRKTESHLNNDEINTAIPIFIGVGKSSYPIRDYASVIEQFGRDKGNCLIDTIQMIISDGDSVQINWEQDSIDEAMNKVLQEITRINPYLDESSLKAIDWIFSYAWK